MNPVGPRFNQNDPLRIATGPDFSFGNDDLKAEIRRLIDGVLTDLKTYTKDEKVLDLMYSRVHESDCRAYGELLENLDIVLDPQEVAEHNLRLYIDPSRFRERDNFIDFFDSNKTQPKSPEDIAVSIKSRELRIMQLINSVRAADLGSGLAQISDLHERESSLNKLQRIIDRFNDTDEILTKLQEQIKNFEENTVFDAELISDMKQAVNIVFNLYKKDHITDENNPDTKYDVFFEEICHAYDCLEQILDLSNSLDYPRQLQKLIREDITFNHNNPVFFLERSLTNSKKELSSVAELDEDLQLVTKISIAARTLLDKVAFHYLVV